MRRSNLRLIGGIFFDKHIPFDGRLLRNLRSQWHTKIKPPVRKWDGREIPVVPPKLTILRACLGRFTLRRPSSASRITPGLRLGLLARAQHAAPLPFTQTAQEGTSASCHRARVSVHALAFLSAFADVLSSVFAFNSSVALYYLQNRGSVKRHLACWYNPLAHEKLNPNSGCFAGRCRDAHPARCGFGEIHRRR